MAELRFPKGFLWGAATSAYQIEGGLTNDWSEWEKSPARVALLKKQGLNPVDFQSGKAANSWEMMDADLECLKQINASAYRFSIDWSRVEPRENEYDEAAIKRYGDFIKKLKAAGIEPFVTLWHWPVPLWLVSRGGWTTDQAINPFVRYAKKIVSSFTDVKFWITLNEPTVYAGDSFLVGKFPPQRKNPLLYLRVMSKLKKAHRQAYDEIKKINAAANIGIATHNIYFEPTALTGLINWWWNHRFLNGIKDKQDFIGLNYYFHHKVFGNENKRVSDLGWELYPEGLYWLIKDLHTVYKKPIYVTESGLADAGDNQRAWYIAETVKNVHRAINEGCDVRGYLHWSLLDNFEWVDGYSPKFGLFSYDKKTFKRSIRPSAKDYALIAKNNSVII